jgi:hypothetical protein
MRLSPMGHHQRALQHQSNVFKIIISQNDVNVARLNPHAAVLPESSFNFNKSLVRINALFDSMLADLPETRDMFTDQRQARVVRQ